MTEKICRKNRTDGFSRCGSRFYGGGRAICSRKSCRSLPRRKRTVECSGACSNGLPFGSFPSLCRILGTFEEVAGRFLSLSLCPVIFLVFSVEIACGLAWVWLEQVKYFQESSDLVDRQHRPTFLTLRTQLDVGHRRSLYIRSHLRPSLH